ncbi:MAG: ABC transporter permease [Bacteroidetes bacterium]|jgi:ABC-2 type transport system permease protein|nr:ABC transporter permease [Bacteroidota bacterium]
MLKTFTTTTKELLLLKRDRTGLLILFIMPALLVIVITLVQENVMQLTGQKKTQVLFLDLDGGMVASSLRQRLAEGDIEIIDLDVKRNSHAALQEAIAAGEYQVGIVIEAGTSKEFLRQAKQLFQRGNTATGPKSPPVSLSLFFDPGVMPGFRSTIKAQMQFALEMIAMETKIEHFGEELETLLDSLGIPEQHRQQLSRNYADRLDRPILILQENRGQITSQKIDYNPVQQNVPAWAIFGMFFTSIPIAGTILQERKSGIWIRLASLPVSQLQLFSGKVLAYIAVCLSQFLLVGLIGIFLFPRIGLPSFSVTHNYPGVLLTIVLISLAACGFGIFLGIVCNSYEQASAVGASFVVTAAAIGGVMVPVYAMPEFMQQVSIISPLNWGLNAFQDLLVRGHSLSMTVDDLGRLTLFFILCIFFAWKLSRSRI